jgi:hypothetical protein
LGTSARAALGERAIVKLPAEPQAFLSALAGGQVPAVPKEGASYEVAITP